MLSFKGTVGFFCSGARRRKVFVEQSGHKSWMKSLSSPIFFFSSGANLLCAWSYSVLSLPLSPSCACFGWRRGVCDLRCSQTRERDRLSDQIWRLGCGALQHFEDVTCLLAQEDLHRNLRLNVSLFSFGLRVWQIPPPPSSSPPPRMKMRCTF